MFVYDSERDQYNKIPKNYLDLELLPLPPPQLVFRRSSIVSNRSSTRSLNRKFAITRLIGRTGRPNIFLSHLPNKNLLYFRDLGNTLLSIRWRWILFTVCSVNFFAFFLFAGLWKGLAALSGDFDDGALEFCVVNTRSFTGYFLLSVETIMTIGYGLRYPTDGCIQGWALIALQCFVSTAIQGALVSVVYVKISKPFTKGVSQLFSKKAVICLRDGKLCLLFRITDLVGKVSVGTKITMYFVDKDINEGAPFRLQPMLLEPHGFLVFPLEISHVIDRNSPLYSLSPYEILTKRLEIVVVAEGSSMVTGQFAQHRTSYINSDILWGHRFKPCVEFNNDRMKFVVNYRDVGGTLGVDTPLCSAEELEGIRRGLE